MFSNYILRMRERAGSTSNVMMGTPNIICTGHSFCSNAQLDARKSVHQSVTCGCITTYVKHQNPSFRVDQLWYVRDTIGMNKGSLSAKAVDSSQTPPRKGWQFFIPPNYIFANSSSIWLEDPHMECGKPIRHCKSVSVVLSGTAQT